MTQQPGIKNFSGDRCRHASTPASVLHNQRDRDRGFVGRRIGHEQRMVTQPFVDFIGAVFGATQAVDLCRPGFAGTLIGRPGKCLSGRAQAIDINQGIIDDLNVFLFKRNDMCG